MFRIIVLKFPCNGVSVVSRGHLFRRFHRTSRHHQKQGSDGSKGGGSVIAYTFGTLTVGTLATITYAAYDPAFRKWMGKNVPYTDAFFKTLFQEEATYLEQLEKIFTDLKTSIYGSIFGEPEKKLEIRNKSVDKDEKKKKEEYKPPPPVFPEVAEKEECPEKPWKEVRVQPKGDVPQIVAEIDKPAELKEDPAKLPETHPKKLADLEAKISSSVSEAVSFYEEAANTLGDYSSLVVQYIENSVSQTDQNSWKRIKEASTRKDEVLKNLNAKTKEATENIEKMKTLLASELNVADDVKEKAKRNLSRIQLSLKQAQLKLDSEKKKTSVTEAYWDKVKHSREYFEQELETLFPSIKLEEKHMHLDPTDFDLFILYAYKTVCFYQKEMEKLETLRDKQLRQALLEGGPDEVLQAKIEAEIDKQRRELEVDFERKALQLRIEAERELRNQLKRQSQAHSDHLEDVIKVKEQEMEREFSRVRSEKEAEDQAHFKAQLAGMVGRLKGLDDALKARAENDRKARQAQILWSACQTLHRSLKAYGPGGAWQQQLRPLRNEIDNVSKAAKDGDELVEAVVKGIPKEAADRGVFTEDAMRERFLKVEKLAWRLALVPECGGKLPLYLLSIIQSFLLVRANNPISAAELADEPVDVKELDTYDVLQRARYWLDRGDFSMTLRYMNLLKGASRAIAEDWMKETRILLETQQAADALMAHAAVSGLLYI